MRYFLICIISLVFSISVNAQTKFSSSTFSAWKARHIGPAVMGGRVTSVVGLKSKPNTIYVGTAAGGIWKTVTGGSVFKPIFDKYTQSIGAIAIDPTNEETLYVGTGESNMRNSVSIGTGMFKSTDGGDNWTAIGLDSTEHISKIIVDPKNNNVIYVAVPGPLWSSSSHRGLYKSNDAGKTWNKILYINENTGCADIALDPNNSQVLWASTWEFRRKPFAFNSGGKGSGLYKSIDGGNTWEKAENGLIEGEKGRIVVTIAPSDPNRMYLIVEGKETALYISENGGKDFKQQSADDNVIARPFYFSTLVVDPIDAKRVYRPAFNFSYSSDGGYSWTGASNEGGWVHSDHHALWIDPNNPSRMYLGTDGGVYMSTDKGSNWLFLNNIPISQFYHVQIDSASPYNVYGGLQDNGSWMAPSQNPNGVQNGDWRNVGGGDGFWVQPDGVNPNIVYSEYQGGHISRYNIKTNESQDIQPRSNNNDLKLRWNWCTPIVKSYHNPKRIYMGSQFLYQSDDEGRSWKKISDDLTTNDPLKQKQEQSGGATVDNTSAENHCTIFYITENPKVKNELWVGTDDGNLQMSKDGGKTWKKLNQNLPNELPKGTWISSINIDPNQSNHVLVSFDNHTYGDMKPYIAESKDGGNTWKMISKDPIKGFAHIVKQDPININLIWVGTEMGLWLSIDKGETWVQYKSNFPATPVRDIVLHPKTKDLVAATHGRGVIIIDDLTALRSITQNVLDKDIALLKTRPVYNTVGHYGGAFPSAGGYVGNNSSEEVAIVYYLKDRVMQGEIKIEVKDKDGKKVYSTVGTNKKGMNIVNWDMRAKAPKTAKGASPNVSGFVGAMVSEGDYTLHIECNGKTDQTTLSLLPYPNDMHSDTDKKLRKQSTDKMYSMIEDLAFINYQVMSLTDTLKKKLENCNDKTLANRSMFILKDSLISFRKTLVATSEAKGITGEEFLREKMGNTWLALVSYDGAPTQTSIDDINVLENSLNKAKTQAKNLLEVELNKVNTELSNNKEAKITIPNFEYFNNNYK